jgi:hypothetical protein
MYLVDKNKLQHALANDPVLLDFLVLHLQHLPRVSALDTARSHPSVVDGPQYQLGKFLERKGVLTHFPVREN